MKNMSRKFIAILVLSILALTACGEQQTKQTPGGSKDTKAESQTKSEASASLEVKEADKGQQSTAVDMSEVAFSPEKNLDTEKVLANYKQAMIDSYVKEYTASPDKVDWKRDISSFYKFYDAGEIKVAPYQGQRLVILDMECDGPCGTAIIRRFAYDEKNDKLTLLSSISNLDWGMGSFAPLEKTADDKFTVKALDIPNAIMLPDGKNSVGLSVMGLDRQKTEQDKTVGTDNEYPAYDFVNLGKVAFTDPKWGNIYFAEEPSNSGCIYLVTPDGVISSYNYDPGLLDEKNYVSVKWADGSPDTFLYSDYSPLFRGCGVGNSCYFVEPVEESKLVAAGKTPKGVTIYQSGDTAEIKGDISPDDNSPKATLNQTYKSYVDMYQYQSDEDKKAHPLLSYDEYLKTHPVIYWKDPFGRFSAFIRNEVKPPAECGKPVIYLYPEKAQEVNVKVGIDQFTKTEPAYGNDGWTVMAQPNGELKNLADGLTYPYLFWEGISKKQVGINSGFVVAKEDLAKFLDKSLAKLGLNEKEKADFVDFWLPKMEAVKAPYLQVSFVGTSDFNKVAPLDITPKPETLIRVFMYYQPLAQKIELPAQKLSALDRRGFTVVEWGGTSSDGWQIK